MSDTIEVVLDDQGHIVIPPTLQSQLGLLPGMTLVVEEGSRGELWLSVRSQTPTLVDKQGVLVIREKVEGNLAEIVQPERDQRSADLKRRTGL